MDGYFDQRQSKQMQAKLREMDKNQVKWRVVNDMSQSNRIQNFHAKQNKPHKFEHRIMSQDSKFKTVALPDDVFRKSHQTLLLK